jgi:hypothetical protein
MVSIIIRGLSISSGSHLHVVPDHHSPIDVASAEQWIIADHKNGNALISPRKQ